MLYRISNTCDHNKPFDQKRAMTYSNHMFSPSQKLSAEEIISVIQNNTFVSSLNATGLELRDIDISGKTFYGCCFFRARFTNVIFEKCRIRMCFFDGATFQDCNLQGSDIQFSCFAGSQMTNTLFTNSDLLHNNFNGLLASNSKFDDSDLYNSRFVLATLKRTSFINCNVKKTMYYHTLRELVSFKSSNTREAIWGKGEDPE